MGAGAHGAVEPGVLAQLVDAVSVGALDQLAAAVADALAPLGVTGCAVLVADFGQTMLADVAADQVRVPIEDTVAGDAYRKQVPSQEAAGNGVRMWLPVTDCGTRLGVLRLDAGEWSPPMEAIAARAAGLVAVTTVSAQLRTDLLKLRRRQKAMSLAADVQWQVLPPTTFIATEFSVSGVLEPAYENGGDAFEYGYTAGVLSFAVIDAMGHGTRASVIASVTLASLRHSRGHGFDLDETRQRADDTIAEQFGDCMYTTALLASYEPVSRRLRWLLAGHPLRCSFEATRSPSWPAGPRRRSGLAAALRRSPAPSFNRVTRSWPTPTGFPRPWTGRRRTNPASSWTR
jgi:hypothetical protein